MGMLTLFRKRKELATPKTDAPTIATPLEYLAVPGTTLAGDDAIAYIGKLADSARTRANVPAPFPTDAFLADAISAQARFLRDTVAPSTTPTLSIAPHGLPSAETFRADLDAIIARSDLHAYVSEITDTPTPPGFTHTALETAAYQAAVAGAGPLKSSFGYRVDTTPEGRLRIALRETHFIDAPDAAARAIPRFTRDTTGTYEVVFGALLLREASDTCRRIDADEKTSVVLSTNSAINDRWVYRIDIPIEAYGHVIADQTKTPPSNPSELVVLGSSARNRILANLANCCESVIDTIVDTNLIYIRNFQSVERYCIQPGFNATDRSRNQGSYSFNDFKQVTDSRGAPVILSNLYVIQLTSDTTNHFNAKDLLLAQFEIRYTSERLDIWPGASIHNSSEKSRRLLQLLTPDAILRGLPRAQPEPEPAPRMHNMLGP